MFEWKVEDMKLMNQRNGWFIGKQKIYYCEDEVSREDKIAFVDSMQDGKLTYLLGLVGKFNNEKMDLPKDRYGNVKTVSLKAWINRNDTKYDTHIFDCDYRYGKYRIFGMDRYITSSYKGSYDIYDDLVDEVFHRQLKECEKLERAYFEQHDEYSILKRKFKDKQYFTTFGAKVACGSNNEVYVYDDHWNRKREITIEELKELIDKHEQVEAFVKKLTEETNIVY